MKLKIKNLYNQISAELQLIWLWVKNLYFVFVSTNSIHRIFEGYMHYWFAKKYADRRSEISKINKYAGGKRHYVIPSGDYSLIVLNRLEIKSLKDRHIISGAVNIDFLLKNAYYITK